MPEIRKIGFDVGGVLCPADGQPTDEPLDTLLELQKTSELYVVSGAKEEDGLPLIQNLLNKGVVFSGYRWGTPYGNKGPACGRLRLDYLIDDSEYELEGLRLKGIVRVLFCSEDEFEGVEKVGDIFMVGGWPGIKSLINQALSNP